MLQKITQHIATETTICFEIKYI